MRARAQRTFSHRRSRTSVVEAAPSHRRGARPAPDAGSGARAARRVTFFILLSQPRVTDVAGGERPSEGHRGVTCTARRAATPVPHTREVGCHPQGPVPGPGCGDGVALRARWASLSRTCDPHFGTQIWSNPTGPRKHEEVWL